MDKQQVPARKLALHELDSRQLAELFRHQLKHGQDAEVESGLDEFDHPLDPKLQPPQPLPEQQP
jgi:hypothetical protein